MLGQRLTLRQAAWRLDEGLPADTEVAIAKLWAADAGHRLAHTTVHVHGGVGIDLDGEAHRYFTAAKRFEFLHGGATEQALAHRPRAGRRARPDRDVEPTVARAVHRAAGAAGRRSRVCVCCEGDRSSPGATTSGRVRASLAAAAASALLDPADEPPHVGVLLDNTPEFSFLLGAAALGGQVPVGLNTTRRGEALAADIARADCQVVAHRRGARRPARRTRRPVDVESPGRGRRGWREHAAAHRSPTPTSGPTTCSC